MTAAERGAGAQETRLVALAGNPNVGKSTIFNALTGMHQHTGNWPGKTVALAQGTCRYKDTEIRLVDLPGTYALVSKSQEEALAAGFVSGGIGALAENSYVVEKRPRMLSCGGAFYVTYVAEAAICRAVYRFQTC